MDLVHVTVLTLLLAGLSMVGPFSIDTYLPAFPRIATSLQATSIEVQQTLTAYMFAFGFMTLYDIEMATMQNSIFALYTSGAVTDWFKLTTMGGVDVKN